MDILSVAQFINCVRGYNKRIVSEHEMNATLALFIRQTTLTDPKKRMKLSDLIEKSDTKLGVGPKLDQSPAAVKKRLKGITAFFDSKAKDDSINTLN